MKKDTAVKSLNKNYNALIETSNKIRDLLYQVEDPDLSEQVDEWCENFEEFLEENDVTNLIETLDAVYDIE
jgi:hypothetical protein